MGTGGISAVSDAGPLIHLVEIDCLSLLCVFENVHIPHAVWSETVEQGRVRLTEISKLSHVQQQALDQAELARFVEENSLKGLHVGECECLCLCQKINVPILLTDDLAVREVAKRLGLVPVGSLGIVVRAFYEGQISLGEAQHYVAALYDVSSLFVTRTIVDLAIEQLNHYADSGIPKDKP